MKQITFDDYIKDQNMKYAITCRHYLYNVCYVQKGRLREPEQCPCDNYETRKSCYENGIPCIGQTRKYKGVSRCFSDETGCYRYCYDPRVLTKNVSDKYETMENTI